MRTTEGALLLAAALSTGLGACHSGPAAKASGAQVNRPESPRSRGCLETAVVEARELRAKGELRRAWLVVTTARQDCCGTEELGQLELELLVDLGRWREAELMAQRLVESPESLPNARAQARRALALARAHARRVRQSAGWQGEARHRQMDALAAWSAGHRDKAARLLESAGERSPPRPSALLDAAVLRRESGQVVEAQRLLDRGFEQLRAAGVEPALWAPPAWQTRVFTQALSIGRTGWVAAALGESTFVFASDGQRRLALPGRPESLTFSPVGTLLAAGEGTWITVWDLTSGARLRQLPTPERGPAAVAFLNEREILVAQGTEARVWDLDKGQVVRRWTLPGSALALAADGSAVACRVGGDAAHLLRLDASVAPHRIPFSDQELQLAGSLRAWVSVTRAYDRAEVFVPGERGPVFTFPGELSTTALAPSGKLLAIAHWERNESDASGVNKVTVWNLRTMAKRLEVQAHSLPTSLMFSPDERQLVGLTEDGPLTSWPLDAPSRVTSASLLGPRIASVSLSPSGVSLILREPEAVIAWSEGQPRRNLEASTNVRQIWSSGDAQQVAGLRGDGSVAVWSSETARELCRIPAGTAPGQQALQVAFSPTGNLVAVRGERGARLFRLSDCAMQGALPVSDFTQTLSFSHDGKRLALGSVNGVVLATVGVDSGPPRVEHSIPCDHCNAASVAFSPDSARLALSTAQGASATVSVRDLASDRELTALYAGSGLGDALAFSPDGSLLAAAVSGVIVWDTDTWLVKIQLATPARVDELRFTGDGHVLAARLEDGSMALWDGPDFTRQLTVVGAGAGAAISAAESGFALLGDVGARDFVCRAGNLLLPATACARELSLSELLAPMGSADERPASSLVSFPQRCGLRPSMTPSERRRTRARCAARGRRSPRATPPRGR